MQRIKYNDSESFYILKRPPMIGPNTLEIHYDGYKKPNTSGLKFYTGLNGDIESVDYSEYTTIWNVLTPLEDGVVYSNNGSVETEDNRLYVPSQEELDIAAKEIAEQTLKDQSKISDDVRLSDIEDAICELYEMLGGE